MFDVDFNVNVQGFHYTVTFDNYIVQFTASFL